MTALDSFYGTEIKPGAVVEYTTQRAHGKHPKGSRCKASRHGRRRRTLVLEFENGDKVTLDGRYYLHGIESIGLFAWFSDKAMKDLRAEEDARVFAILEELR